MGDGGGQTFVRTESVAVFEAADRLLPHLDVELTERCNNACIHCYINRPEDDESARTRELDAEALEETLGEAATLGCLSVRFTGGEPLLRSDFPRLYLAARRLCLAVTLFTNGRLVTPDLADLLARVPPGRPVQVSVYGMTAESYEAVSRAPGSFAEFRRGVELLQARGVPLVLKGVLLPPNEQELAAFGAWAREVTATAEPPGVISTLELRSRRDSPEDNARIRDLRPSPNNALDLDERPGAAYREDLAAFCETLRGPGGDRLFACGAGRSVCLDAHGSLQACMLLRDPATTYDLRAGSLRDALNHFFPDLLERRAANPAYLERCGRCFLRGLCEQCPARSWSEHGTLDTPVEHLCALAHAQARELGLLGPDEHGWEVVAWRERIACSRR